MGEVLAVRNEYRAQNWVQVIQECRASGLTNRAFCRQRGIPEKKFYYWLRKLRTQALETAKDNGEEHYEYPLLVLTACPIMAEHRPTEFWNA